ncbi:serine hydrolase domain-containing protein [Marivirga salinae]|uniref:Serine hydrolase domain-containing protein n=1 Tax=Marivirga salinarum TaxID=3059078 RepID=A0AA49GBS9_9BACT|nr:serine hydrolase domain-containing protein [Marivirga sp. BDSF4-3]WKK74705.2 serine hydrolase domain-containing protein [Marivirga sp. BDSF4-3]
MKNILIILVSILVVSCQNTKPKENIEYSDLIKKIDSISVNNGFNGVILVTKDTTTIYSKAFGYSDLENKTPMNMENQFVIGSISKQITAVLVLREYEKGNLKLDDKIIQYLPDIKQSWANEVTIHHLLVHTHGIVDLNKPLEFELGSQFHYSQFGYELLSQILEKITGKTFNELSTECFAEYGLKNTYHPDNKNYKSLVKGYEETENGKLEFVTNSLENYVAAGAFISNAKDLSKWNKMLYSGKLINEKTLILMETRYATRLHPIFDKIEYGYGLLFKDGENNTQIGAFGYAPGFVSACYHYPQTNMNLIVLENTARKLDNFKETFHVHTELMELIKKRTPNNVYTK